MTSPTGATGALAMLGSAIGSIFGAYGSLEGGQAGQAMSNYRAQVANINAYIAREQGAADITVGDIQAQRSGIATGQRMGETRAGIAAGNLDTGTGSAKQILSSEAEVGQFEQASIRNTAARQAYTRQIGAFEDTAQAQVDIVAGQQLKEAGKIGAITSILGGASQVSDKWTKYTENTGDGSGSPATVYPDPNNPGGFAPGYS